MGGPDPEKLGAGPAVIHRATNPCADWPPSGSGAATPCGLNKAGEATHKQEGGPDREGKEDLEPQLLHGRMIAYPPNSLPPSSQTRMAEKKPKNRTAQIIAARR